MYKKKKNKTKNNNNKTPRCEALGKNKKNTLSLYIIVEWKISTGRSSPRAAPSYKIYSVRCVRRTQLL